MKTIREVRKELGLTQAEAAKALNVSRRTIQNYEKIDVDNPKKATSYFQYILSTLENYCIDEEHGFVTLKQIKKAAAHIFSKHEQVKCAYLFGSYARGEEKPTSDVDILVVVDGAMGLEYYGMAGDLADYLHKNVDLVSHRQVVGSEDFLERILRESIKIYDEKNK